LEEEARQEEQHLVKEIILSLPQSHHQAVVYREIERERKLRR
jgi:hypothetical protein